MMSIIMPRIPGEWTLTEAARLLGEPQHKLIYLCEKGVVEPDVQDAEGRGSSRRFSARNLLEFAVALRLRALDLPASLIGAVVYLLRAFEKSMAKRASGFKLPESLQNRTGPDLRVVIDDGQRLYFTLGAAGSSPKIFGGIDLLGLQRSPKGLGRLERQLAQRIRRDEQAEGGDGPAGSRHARVEVNVTAIARDLDLEA